MSEFKFSCPNCGQHLAATPAWYGQSLKCPACQQDLIVPMPAGMGAPAPNVAPSAPPAPGGGPGLRFSRAAPPATVETPWRQGAAVAGGKMSGLAIASFVCGFVPCVGWLAALICGHLAWSHMKRDRSLRGKGFAVAGLILGYIAVLGILGFTYSTYRAGRGFFDALKQAKWEVTQRPGSISVHGGAPDPGSLFPPSASSGSSGSGLGLTLEVSRSKFFQDKEAYSLNAQATGLDGHTFSASGVEVLEFELHSPVLNGEGKLRATAPGQVEITMTMTSSKPYRLGVRGLRAAQAKAAGSPLDLSKPIPAGKRVIVVTGGYSGAAASQNQR